MLVFADGRLVAVLVHLSDENEIAPGDWHWDWIVKRLGTALTLP